MNNPDFDYQLFFELSPDLFCIAGFDGYFKKVNNAVCNLLGYTRQELMEKPIQYFVYGEDKALTQEKRQALRSGNALMNFENRYLAKNGEIVWLAWTSMPVPEQQLVYAVAKNITQAKQLNNDRTELIKNLNRINDDLRLLIYTTSHDLRAPVNNLMGVFNLLDVSKIEDRETFELIGMLGKASESLRATLNNYTAILNEKNIVKVETETLSFEACFKQVLQSLSAVLKNTGTTISTEFSAETVIFNKGYLESIFLNLLTNAIKYAKPGSNPAINISTQIVNHATQLVFSDDGLGFEMGAVKDKLFGFGESFHNHADSKGVGLFLVKAHVNSLGGKIEAESSVNKGARFTITFAS